MFATLGSKAIDDVMSIGQFGRFVWQTSGACLRGCWSHRMWPLVWTQMHIIGVRSVPVVMITGARYGPGSVFGGATGLGVFASYALPDHLCGFVGHLRRLLRGRCAI